MLLDDNSEEYICEECDLEFDSQAELRQHREDVHEEKEDSGRPRRRNVA
ncbi:MAG: hypothetical protein HYX72_06100 [Acidobacteria bacterium]|nr:hypothetical protein [Acidobacteriota bacterium]